MARIADTGRCEPEIVAASSRQSEGPPIRYPPTISSATAGITTTSQSRDHPVRRWPPGPTARLRPGLARSPEVAGSDRVLRTRSTSFRPAENQVARPGGRLEVEVKPAQVVAVLLEVVGEEQHRPPRRGEVEHDRRVVGDQYVGHQ